MSTKKWKTQLNEAHAANLPLIITSLLCVQILSAARDPIVIGWDLPIWLVLLDAAFILINVGLVLWVRANTFSDTANYLVTSFALILAGIKVCVLIVVESRSLPFYTAVVMLAGSLCFLSIRYLLISMGVILAAWATIAAPTLTTGEMASSLTIALLGAGLSVMVLHRRIASAIQLFELEQRVVTLESILPMCANCKKTRDHTGKWQSIEEYIEDQQAGTQISHGSCPSCTEEMYGDLLKNR